MVEGAVQQDEARAARELVEGGGQVRRQGAWTSVLPGVVDGEGSDHQAVEGGFGGGVPGPVVVLADDGAGGEVVGQRVQSGSRGVDGERRRLAEHEQAEGVVQFGVGEQGRLWWNGWLPPCRCARPW